MLSLWALDLIKLAYWICLREKRMVRNDGAQRGADCKTWGTSDKTMASKYISGKDFRLHGGFERILSEAGVK